MRKYNTYTFQKWFRSAKAVAAQLVIPFTIFQAIRTFLMPTTFDVLLLAIFIVIAVSINFEWI
ncbi:membrane protein [Bacillus coahuilensis m2-6]|uniref:Membrane protein n=1 Tax=Bacillus coahuilensis p1.1.43 TaxID=1150625 RepID=A0A147K750_9BACI|nr:hypothetical protein [Bacillus coahuilensis]KUP05886.1 membrane protein [Bacillus coahuilensis p1.1.43]KUP06982.1 membrane protein [Bacillus coahuilensis m2-6]